MLGRTSLICIQNIFYYGSRVVCCHCFSCWSYEKHELEKAHLWCRRFFFNWVQRLWLTQITVWSLIKLNYINNLHCNEPMNSPLSNIWDISQSNKKRMIKSNLGYNNLPLRNSRSKSRFLILTYSTYVESKDPFSMFHPFFKPQANA